MQSYFVAETEMGSRPFDFAGAGQSFNTLADYLFGNVRNPRSKSGVVSSPRHALPCVFTAESSLSTVVPSTAIVHMLPSYFSRLRNWLQLSCLLSSWPKLPLLIDHSPDEGLC